MKRPPFFLQLALLFLVSYAVGLFSRTWLPGFSAPAAPPAQAVQAVRAPPPNPGNAQTSQPAPKLAKALEDGSGPELFHTLQGAPFPAFPTISEALENRFRSPYPLQERAALAETVSRMGILHAMSSAYAQVPAADQHAINSFYLAVATDDGERPPVRHQAYRNLASTAGHLPEDKRYRAFASTPPALLATMSKDKSELLEEIFRHGK